MILADVSTAVEVCDARDDDPGCGRRVQKTFHAGKKVWHVLFEKHQAMIKWIS